MFEMLTQKQMDQLDTLTKLLQTENTKFNLTSITDTDEIRSRHFEDSLIAVKYFKELSQEGSCSKRCVDIGSGAGFPGLVLAVALPDWEFVSIEATGKKVLFQKMAAEKMQLQNFQAVHGRAEELAHQPQYREKFDIATCRAVGHLAVIVELCIPFISKGGLMLSWKGSKVNDELVPGQKAANDIGGGLFQQNFYSTSGELRIISCKKIANTSANYPRTFQRIICSV